MSVLIVDDAAESRALLRQMLQGSGYADSVAAGTAADAWRTLETLAAPIDVILLDILLPDQNGIDFCRRLRSDSRFRDIPVIMVTALSGADDLEAAFAAGANDYVIKPIQVVELLARLRSTLALKREMDWRKHRERELLEVTHQLELANSRLQRLSSLDGLTEIPNRRAFDRYLDRNWRYAVRKQTSLALLMLDIDNFKLFNDTRGHQCGDECLKRVAGVLTHAIHRPMDFAARYGGEEFGVILAETDATGAMVVAESLRARVEDFEEEAEIWPLGDHITISVGVAATVAGPESSAAHLVAAADEALYQAKAAGRNCVKLTSGQRVEYPPGVPIDQFPPGAMAESRKVKKHPAGRPGPHLVSSPSEVPR
jgi:diguanylate cyclase (GGDEF)-like protein